MAETANSDQGGAYRSAADGRDRRLALLILSGCCAILAGWTVVLGVTLPHTFGIHHWRAVWIGFDTLLLAAFATTAWAAWRRRQVLILLLMVVGTMLCCDAWFDVTTSLKTKGMWLSLASAILAELPLAFAAFFAARRLLAATVAAAAAPASDGTPVPRPRLRHTSLAGNGVAEALPRSARPGPG